jgi:hypothetical protein
MGLLEICNLVAPRGGLRVEEYRAYFLGRDGHFNGYEPLVCANDEVAIESAKRLVNKYGIELWSGARLVMCLSHLRKTKAGTEG